MSAAHSKTSKGTAFVNLVETLHVASDLATRERVSDTTFLETLKDTPKNREKLHAKRLKALAEGRVVMVLRTMLRHDDARFGKNRARRRWEKDATRRLLRRLRKRVTPKQQREVDKEIDKMFEDRDTGERRTKSGIILPKREGGRRGNR